MNPSLRTRGPRQPLAALAAVLMLALASTPTQAAGPGLTGYVYALDAKGKITGTVPGASLEFHGAEVVKATANQNGLYTANLRAGTYTYKVTATGFKDEDIGRALTTGGGDSYQIKNFSLSPGKTDPTRKPPGNPAVAAGILQGDVVEKTADGKEVSIPGATVYLRNQNPQQKSHLSQTLTRSHDDKTRQGQRPGHYELELAAATYTASVVASGFDRFKQVEPVTIVAGNTATQRFVLTRAAAADPKGQGIEGTVHLADPGKAAAALPPITVSLVPVGRADRPVATFNPNPTGGFQRNLLAGRYRMEFQAKGYRTYPHPIPDVYVLGGSFTKVNVYLVPDLLFGATVYERVGRRVKLLPGASVELVNSGEPASKPVQLTTGKNGYASVPLAREGTYVAVARLAGYADARGVPVKVSATGANRAVIELVRETTPPPAALVTVPDLRGASESVVQSTLAAVDLKEEFTGKPSLGPVKAQNYPSGSKVKPGTTIVVSFPETPPPPALVTVPNVTGLNLPDVQSTLAAVGLKVVATGDSKLGPSTFQNYSAGKHVYPGTVIAVTFPEKPPPPALITVPNVTGVTWPVARSTLVAAGLQADLTGDPNQGPSTFQNYHAGAHENPGTVVVVYFPEKPPPPALVIVPNVTGLNQPDVQTTLQAVGLQEQFTGNPSLGPARSQNYRAGMHVNPGTVVAVYFPEERPTPPPPPVNTLVTVPSLVGSTGPIVRDALLAAGLNASVTGNPSLGPATFQNPRPGIQVRPGTTVAVYFPETANREYPTPAPASQHLFAAIAHSRSTGQTGYGYNFASLEAAKAKAIQDCYASDAQVAVWVRDGFCALALGDDKSHCGIGYSANYNDTDYVRSQALAQCNQRTPNAHIVLGVYANNTAPEVYK